MMRLVARFFLWLTGVAIPVVIAACYGAPYGFSKCGKVVDAESKEGIEGIEVLCMRDGAQESMSYTGVEGGFCVHYDAACDTLDLADVDGAENGGEYQAKSVSFDEQAAELTIELSK